jgi:tetratricopeptide (TPR) repeat protein
MTKPSSIRGMGLVLGLSLLLATGSAYASSQEVFRKANAAYEEGRIADSVRLYEKLAQRREIADADLYYNLGNAYYKMGKLGLAIYNYERALRLDPDMSDARYNLDVARKTALDRAGDKVVGATQEPFWVRMVKAMTPTGLSIWFLVFWYLTFGLLIALFYLGRGAWRVLAVSGSSLFGVAALVFGLLLAGRVYLEKTVPQGIVIRQKVEVLEGPRENAATAFKVHSGLKVRILESDVEWYKIQLSNGLEGWVKRKQVGRL